MEFGYYSINYHVLIGWIIGAVGAIVGLRAFLNIGATSSRVHRSPGFTKFP